MTTSRIFKFVLTLALVIGTARELRADSVFNFESDAVGTPTQFSNTSTGLTATFSSSADPDGFEVFPALGFVTLPGNFLAQGALTPPDIPLQIAFSSNINNISMNFGFASSDTFILDAYEGSTLVGAVSVFAAASPDTDLAEGIISFSGATFNSVVLNSVSGGFFGIDNVTIKSVAVPEPATLLLFGLGLVGIGLLRRVREADQI